MPLEIVLTVLLALVIFLVFKVNSSSNELAELMEKSGIYLQELSDLQAGINTLSETASGFVQSPTAEDGSANFGPLMAFAEELGRDRRGPQIAERFHNYTVSDEVRAYVDHAAETTVTMREAQDHAIALVRSVYPLPPVPALSAVPDVPLTEEELAMPPEARIGAARKMLGGDYAQLKYSVAEDVGNGGRILREAFSRSAGETKRHLANLRTNLWIVIACIVVILFAVFLLLRLWVVDPLRSHVEKINADISMIQQSGFREMQVLASAYNELLDRRNKLESILRSAAETDALTGLPNRYSLERNMLEIGEDRSSMAVLVFDVNYLKQINDRNGHLAGDSLIRKAAECIRECFSSERGDNCYRIGGDEFAAVLRGCDETEIKTRLKRFALAQERESISISVGYGFARRTNEDSFKKLFAEADRQMYIKKQKVHELSK